MKRSRTFIVAIFLGMALLAGGCAEKQNPNLTPVGVNAATNTSILQRIREFQSVVIKANLDGQIPDPQADRYVQWAVDAARYLGTNPQGVYSPIVQGGWTAIRDDVSKWPQLQYLVPVLNELLISATK